MRVDVFIDLTSAGLGAAGIEAALRRWQHPEQLGALESSRTVVTRSPLASRPDGGAGSWFFTTSEPPPIETLSAALEAAGSRGAALLVLSGPVDAGSEMLGELRQQLDRDPMFGFAVPRICCGTRCCIARLGRNSANGSDWLDRSVLAELPDTAILVETASPVVLVAPQVTGNFGPLDTAFSSVQAALLHYMASARRCGFRTVVCNRAVVALHGQTCDAPPTDIAIPRSDADLLARTVPDLERSWAQFGGGSFERFETLYAARPGACKGTTRPSLLLDIRNVIGVHNGTSHAVLGLTSALRDFAQHWSISLLASEDGARFHALAREFPDWPIHTTVPERAFTVAFRPSQPWHITEMADLHATALINAYLLLDTIAWDVAYCAPPHLDGVWHFLAAYADGLLYDSEFTRQRFARRFPEGARVPGAVTHFSFDPSDYRNGGSAQAQAGSYILIVGNHLDHKDVRGTARTLASAFPYRQIRVLGPTDVVSPCVSAHPSGALANSEIHQLYAGAEVVVYPSFYEGFGFPILTALAYGRTVLVRRSALVEELAPLCHGSGRLVPFERREDLVELVGRLGAGQPVAELPLAPRGQAQPRRWPDVARDTHRFLSSLIDEQPPGRWLARDRVLGQFLSFRT